MLALWLATMPIQWLPAPGKIICCMQHLLEEHSLEASWRLRAWKLHLQTSRKQSKFRLTCTKCDSFFEISSWIHQGHCRDRSRQEVHPEPLRRNIGRAFGRGGRIWIRRIPCFDHSWGTCCCLPVYHSKAKNLPALSLSNFKLYFIQLFKFGRSSLPKARSKRPSSIQCWMWQLSIRIRESCSIKSWMSIEFFLYRNFRLNDHNVCVELSALAAQKKKDQEKCCSNIFCLPSRTSAVRTSFLLRPLRPQQATLRLWPNHSIRWLSQNFGACCEWKPGATIPSQPNSFCCRIRHCFECWVFGAAKSVAASS